MKDLWFFLRLFKPYHYWLIGGVMLSLATALASIALLSLSGWFICAAAVAGAMVPDGVAVAFNYMQPAAQVRALAIIRTLSRYGERLVTHEATFRVLAQIRSWFFARMIPLSPAQLGLQRSGDILNRMTADIDALDALYLRLALPFLVALMSSLVVVAWLAAISASLAGGLAVMILLTIFALPMLFNRLGQAGAAQETDAMANLKTRQIEILQGFTDLVVFKALNRFKDALLVRSQRLIDIQADNDRLSAKSAALNLLLAQTTAFLLLMAGAVLMQQRAITGPQTAALVFAVLALFEWIGPLSQAMLMLGKTKLAAERIRSLAETKPIVTELEGNIDLPMACDWRLESIGFRYQGKSDWVLRQIDLEIAQGDKIAIVGPSGAGKSTLLHLLMRFFDPEQGRLLLNGVDIRQVSIDQLYRRMALLSQRTQLFAGTIRDNLLLGKPDADSEDLTAAIKLAGLSTLLAKLPDGVDTVVGEQGSRVSGGEARRIALARVYLKNAPILLLDEPTEGLDRHTEADVLRALQQISANKTVVMVTHRTAGLDIVERVYRLENGRLELDK